MVEKIFGDRHTVHDLLEAVFGPDLDPSVHQRAIQWIIDQLSRLSVRNKERNTTIFKLYFGFDQESPKKSTGIAERFGMKPTAVTKQIRTMCSSLIKLIQQEGVSARSFLESS